MDPSERVNALAVLSAIPRERALPVPLATRETVEPLRLRAPVVLPAVKVAPLPVEREVLPEDERVVKAAEEGVVAPIAVLLIPVAVVLKLEEVMVKALAPVEILDAPRPERVSAPEVPVIVTGPVVTVRPLEAVRRADEVMVPSKPVVVKLPEVVALPFSSTVKEVKPLDWTVIALLTAALVSLMTKAFAVPALVRVKDVAVPESEDWS